MTFETANLEAQCILILKGGELRHFKATLHVAGIQQTYKDVVSTAVKLT